MADICCSNDSPADSKVSWYKDRNLLLASAAGICWLAALLCSALSQPVFAHILNWIALILGGLVFVPGAIKRLVVGPKRLNVAVLMTIAAIGAILLGHVDQSAALAFLFSIAETLEDRALNRARTGLSALSDLLKINSTVVRDGNRVRLSADQIKAGDRMLIPAGATLATDGVVASGQSWLNTSAITGESIPVSVSAGDQVAAGSLNTSGELEVIASADGVDNSLTKIVALVEGGAARKGNAARLADRIAAPLVPTVLIVSVLIAVLGSLLGGDPKLWIERALVVLVAASPCALAIAVPVTVISAIGAASKLGIIIKSGSAFEKFATIKRIAFDKTGTLTKNQPTVISTYCDQSIDSAELLNIAASIESASSHPLAQAIVASAKVTYPATDLVELAGMGASGYIGSDLIKAGSTQWLNTDQFTQQCEQLENIGASVIVVQRNDRTIGLIGIRDELRSEAKTAITMLRKLNVETVMLTGDSQNCANYLAKQVGISQVKARALPVDKANYITEYTATLPTAMVGDGINDAPALAQASVGIAMGTSKTAAAMQSADIAFNGADLRLIPYALSHVRRAVGIMRFNIGIAITLISVLFPLALFGILPIAAVVFIHELAEVIIIANGIRAAGAVKKVTADDQTRTASTAKQFNDSLTTASTEQQCSCCD